MPSGTGRGGEMPSGSAASKCSRPLSLGKPVESRALGDMHMLVDSLIETERYSTCLIVRCRFVAQEDICARKVK